MTKLRLTISFEIEYEPEPEFYQNRTPLGMLEVDINNARRDPMLYIDMSKQKVSVSGEVVGEEK